MSKVQLLRALVNQRLTAAAEEIIGLFERTIAEYEEELCRSKEENERQRKLLDTVFSPRVRLHRAVVPADIQQLLVSKEVPPEQQKWSFRLHQEDQQELRHIKEEEEKLWSSQEEEQLQELEQADITKFTFTLVPVKSEEDDEEKPQTSQLHQTQTAQIKTEAEGHDCGRPEPTRNSDPEKHLQPETDDKTEDFSEESVDNWTEPVQSQLALSSVKVTVSDVKFNTDEKSTTCSECDETLCSKSSLNVHNKCHTGEKPFSCSVCGKKFSRKSTLKRHMRIHTGEKPFSCSFCNKSFSRREHSIAHVRCHTGEKPYSCSFCSKCFSRNMDVQIHMRTHTGEKPYRCPYCSRCFSQCTHLQSHMRSHTGEKPFICSICDKRFNWRHQIKRHKCGGESSKLHELWRSQEGEQLQGLEEADINKSTFTPVPVKSEEDDEEKPQSSRFHQMQTVQIKTEDEGHDCGGPEPARNSDSERHLQLETNLKTEDFHEPMTDVWKDTKEPQRGLNSLKNNEVLENDVGCNTDEKAFSCSYCGKKFSRNSKLKIHMRIHTGEKPFSCSLCSKRFTQKVGMDQHLKTHTGEKPYCCSLCNKCFSRCEHLQRHMRTHTGEKPFSCSVCDKKYTRRHQLKRHKCRGESSELHELWSSQEGEQLPGLGEADITKFTCTAVPVKSEEDDKGKSQTSQFHQTQTEQMRTEADGDNCGRAEPARNSDQVSLYMG